MKKSKIKNIVACVVFCVLTFALIGRVNDIVVSKKYNRYYMMEKTIEQQNETYDVQVFGACHSYTSFYPQYLEENYQISSYAMGNPGEIVPVTYLRMMEQFKKDVPEVALVEIWGLNAYETYSSQERVFEYYMPVNIERLPLSLEKIEVIKDYYSLDLLLENFAIAKYKDRIMESDLMDADFEYSLETNVKHSSKYTREEMTVRAQNNGFCEMPMWLDDPARYTPYMSIADYAERQPDIAEDDMLAYEPDIVKYIDKIISLCDENDVELIIYRAPYVSKENELRKINWLADYCEKNGVLFLDLEKEINFDYSADFLDYYHLNKAGALKATEFMTPYILDAMGRN